jgi:tRNA G10  N-methylase Trm11
MYIAILGRQPALGMAELEHLYDNTATRWFSDQSALIDTDSFSIDHLGGTQKAGRVILELPRADWHTISLKIVQTYSHKWSHASGKITLGISAYGFDIAPRDVQKTGILLKQKLKKATVSLRLIPNTEPALTSATAHHNKLGLSPNKIELIVVRTRGGRVVVSESIGAQNITAYTKRDQERPKRDAFVGMLPPKLAQIMINLALPPGVVHPPEPAHSGNGFADAPPELSTAVDVSSNEEVRSGISEHHNSLRLLDPFCGTGVILQEAALMGNSVYGTDIADKMIDFTQANLQWLATTHHLTIDTTISQGDATTTTWQPPIDIVVCESYLGQPFSAPPSPSKLEQVRSNCNHIISTFLQNIGSQLTSGTPLCIAVPAWKATNGHFTHLPLVDQLEQLGYTRHPFKHSTPSELLYYREDQIVARELLVITKS